MYKNYEHMDMLVLGVRVIHTGGLLALHNARHPDKRVELNDVFVSVNGVGGDWDRMLSECEKDTVNVVVERPAEPVPEASNGAVDPTSIMPRDLTSIMPRLGESAAKEEVRSVAAYFQEQDVRGLLRTL